MGKMTLAQAEWSGGDPSDGMLPALPCIASATLSTAAIEFASTVQIGRHIFWPVGFAGFGDGLHALGKGDRGWHGTVNGGRSWAAIPSMASTPYTGAGVLSADGRTLHDLGTVTAVADRDGAYSSFNSSTTTSLSWNGSFIADEQHTPIIFRGLPQPATCGDTSHAFGCPFRTGGRGYVRLVDGTLVMSIIVYWGGAHANPTPALAPVATSIVAFRSMDGGYLWEYASTVVDAAGEPDSEEGPNENDLALLRDGSILCVFRLDAGDGRQAHPFRSYAKSVSTDGGLTWSTPVPLPKSIGCARPRLLRLAAGGLLMSGGRLGPRNHDNYIWWNARGDGVLWEPHSISYWHNGARPPVCLSSRPPSALPTCVRGQSMRTTLCRLMQTDAAHMPCALGAC